MRVQGRPLVMTQTWAEIVWCHWRVPMSAMDGRFPPGVRAQEHDGSAWVGLVPFEMRDLRLAVAGRTMPTVPTTGAFSEVNVRTYVTGPAGPGVWFDTLDASTPLGAIVARAAWSLPYVRSRITASVDTPRPPDEAPDLHPRRAWSVERVDGTTARVDARVGAEIDASALDRFLTERYSLYARAWWAPRRALWAPVDHAPWTLHEGQAVDVDAGVVRAAGYPVTDRPDVVTAGEAVQVKVGLPRLL